MTTYAEFQALFEEHAQAEKERFDAMTVAALISEIRAGRLGAYHQIWHSLAARARPAEVNDLLLEFLSSSADYLDRYHCAAALLGVNGLTGWEPAHLSAERRFPVAENLEKIRARLGCV